MSFIQHMLIPGTGFSLAEGLAYGPEARHRLDIYTPRGAPPRGSVLFVYGGSWTSGTRTLYRFLGAALAGRGYQTIVADYRLSPQVAYPAFVDDTARAFVWAKTHIGGHGGDPSRLFLMGHSAGAYNVAMIALDPAWLAAHGARPAHALGVAALAGPLSFHPLKTETTRPIFAPAPDIEAARPIKLAAAHAADAPPFLLLHGTADRTVGPHNSANFADAMQAAGGRAALKLYPRAGHLTVMACFAWPMRWRAPGLDDVDAFFAGCLSG